MPSESVIADVTQATRGLKLLRTEIGLLLPPPPGAPGGAVKHVIMTSNYL